LRLKGFYLAMGTIGFVGAFSNAEGLFDRVFVLAFG